MSNVVSLRARGIRIGRSEARDTAALASDLVEIVARLKAASGRAADPPLQLRAREVEETIQRLLDAMASVRRAADPPTDEGGFAPD